MALSTLRKLLRWRRASQQTELQHPQRAAEEFERDQDLLERVAAGIALNKTPGR